MEAGKNRKKEKEAYRCVTVCHHSLRFLLIFSFLCFLYENNSLTPGQDPQ